MTHRWLRLLLLLSLLLNGVLLGMSLPYWQDSARLDALQAQALLQIERNLAREEELLTRLTRLKDLQRRGDAILQRALAHDCTRL